MQQARRMGGVVPQRQVNVVFILIGINLLFFFLQLIPGFTETFMLIAGDALARPWTLFTSMFLHGSMGHFLFNMYALFIFGPLILARLGTKRFLGAYFGAGLVAGISYVLYSLFIMGNPNAAALGASGAIMGILGLVIMLLPNLKVLFFFVVPMSMRTAGIIFALIDIVGLFNPGSGIAHIAHLGGLAVGVLYGWYLIKKRKEFAKVFVRVTPKTTRHSPERDKNKTIELSKDDIDNYFKYGKI